MDAAANTPDRPGRLKEFWYYFREIRGAVFGLWIFLAFPFIAIFAPLIAPFDPTEQFREHLLRPPVWQEGGSWAFPLGTDVVGRDMTMIFQEPVSSLNPCFTVGFQIREALRKRLNLNREERLDLAICSFRMTCPCSGISQTISL